MGTPNVFQISFTGFIGVGIGFMILHSGKYGKTLNIGISLPFICIEIFCRKEEDNNWI